MHLTPALVLKLAESAAAAREPVVLGKKRCKGIWLSPAYPGVRSETKWTKMDKAGSNSPGSGIPLGFSGKSGSLEKRDLNQFSIP